LQEIGGINVDICVSECVFLFAYKSFDVLSWFKKLEIL